MNIIRKFLFFLFAIFVFIVALLAAADNSEPVTLKFLEFESIPWPLSWWMLLAFVVGVLFATLLNSVTNTRLRLDARAANKTADHRTRELDQVKAEKTVPEGNS